MLPFPDPPFTRVPQTARLIVLCCLILAASVDAQTRGGRIHQSPEGPAAANPITISAPTFTRGTPSTFVVPLSVNDLTGRGIIAFQFNLGYTSTVIDPTGVNFGCSTSGTISGVAGATATCNVDPDGTLLVSVHSSNVLAGSGTVLNLIFKTDVTAVSGNFSPLNFDQAAFFSDQGLVTSTSTNGQVTLTSVSTAGEVSLSGRVLNTAGRGIRAAVVTVSGGGLLEPISVLVGPLGVYEIDHLRANRSYVVSVSQPRYRFEAVVVDLKDNATGFDLIALP